MYNFLSSLSLSGITVWPHPTELSVNGMKVAQYKMISQAAHSLGIRSPSITVLTHEELLQMVGSLGRECWAVIKRERSRVGQHCYLPEDGSTPDSRIKTLKKQLAEEQGLWELGQTRLGLPRPRWFAQSYVPQLHHIGEIRFIFVNGMLQHWVYTIPAKNHELEVETNVPILDPQFIRCVPIQIQMAAIIY